MTTAAEPLPAPRSTGSSSSRSRNARRGVGVDSLAARPPRKQKSRHDASQTPQLLRVAHIQKPGSGDSGSDLSGSKWFDQVNKDAAQGRRDEGGYDDDPPFFMSDHATYAPDGPRYRVHDTVHEDLFGVPPRDDSENEDLRDVIDDLTVENKRLKRILRQGKARGAPQTPPGDKLFEVRMHGLTANKKRELETLLKNFASAMHQVAETGSTSTLNNGLARQSSESLQSSTAGQVVGQVPTDSGYASNSQSHRVSAKTSTGRPSNPFMSRASKDKSIKTYLHDIPDTLLPKRPMVISESSKMVLVVRRLEQLFLGKQAAPGEHSQPVQQQEISQSAALADRQEDVKNNRKRRAEGAREAHVLPPDSIVNLDEQEYVESSPEKGRLAKVRSDMSDVSLSDGPLSISRPLSPNQRPTRPLDLDIDRSVIAAENIEYIRHLGLSSPHIGRTDDPDGKEEPWLYLNLLISMAQLHTFNVTPDFIRQAIRKLSTKFELSKDGHRVRWKGGSEGTKFLHDHERAVDSIHLSPPESTADLLSGSSKRSKTHSASNVVVSTNRSSERISPPQPSTHSNRPFSISPLSGLDASVLSARARPATAFDYQPVVFKGKETSTSESYNDSSSSYEDHSGADPTELAHALSRSSLNQGHPEEGLLTFYNNPHFFSDYTGDHAPVNMKSSTRHKSRDEDILGTAKKMDAGESPLRHSDACYFTPQFAVRGFDDDGSLPSFSPPPLSAAGEDEAEPMELPASGLGGIFPQENFAIDVKIERRPHPPMPATRRPFTGTLAPTSYTYRMAGAKRLELRPSPLPPPSYIFLTTSSSSSAPDMMDTSNGSGTTSSLADEEPPVSPAVLARFSTESSQHHVTAESSLTSDEMADEDEDDEANDDDDDDESVDMLGVARAVDPQAVAVQERLYELRQSSAAPVAGSLAATAGATTRSSSEVSSVTSSAEDDDYDGSEMSVDQ